MQRLKYFLFFASLLVFTPVKSMAMSCHGGGGEEHQSGQPKQAEQSKGNEPFKESVITVLSPVTLTGTLVCPGEYLYRNKKGYWHGDEKCRNLAVLIEKVEECQKPPADCPYAGKLYYILSSDKGDKLLKNNRLKNKEVNIKGKLYEAERAIEVMEFSEK